MSDNSVPISRDKLLTKANQIIREHEDYIDGMCATTVRQENQILVFGGEYFLDDNGLPTAKSTAAFNMFKHLAHLLSEKYRLID